MLVEKPLATSVDDGEELVAAAAEHEVPLMVGHTFEYNPRCGSCATSCRSGELGRVLYVDSARLSLGPVPARRQRDLGPRPPRHLDPSHLLGELPVATALWVAHAHRPVRDVAYLRLDFRERARVHPRELAGPEQGAAG